jgi:hypothetical protein
MTVTLQPLYGFRDLKLAIQTKLGELTDPEADDPTIPLFKTVKLTKPANVSLYNGPLIILKITQVPTAEPKGVNNQADKATYNGTAYLFIPGDTDESALLCDHYTDILGTFFKTRTALTDILPGTQLRRPSGVVHDFRVVIVDPKNPKNPKKSTASITNFVVLKGPKTST